MRTAEELADFNLLHEICKGVAARIDRIGFDGLNPAERSVYAVWWLEADVNNGGFNQYFFNSYGGTVREARDTLHSLGFHKQAEIVDCAMNVFVPNGPPTDWFQRQEQLLALPESAVAKLEVLTEAFFEYPDGPIEPHLAIYARGKSAQFLFPRQYS